MPQSHNRYCPSTSVTPLLPLHKHTNTGNCTPSLHETLFPSLTTVTALLPPSHHYCLYISRSIPVTAPPHYTNIMPQSHNRYCSSTSVTPLLPPHKQTNTGNCIPSLHKILCPSLTTVTAILPPSHHYCRYISIPIPVNASPHFTKFIPHSLNRYCPSTSVAPLLPLHKQTNTGNCIPSLYKTLCPSLTTVTELLPPTQQ